MRIYGLKIADLTQEEIHRYSSFISVEKRTKILRMRKKRDQIRGLLGELLIRKRIISDLGMRNDEIHLGTNEYGKPHLVGYPDYHFNIAHSGDYVVCAVNNQPVGIDIEKMKEIEYQPIIQSFFTIQEATYILQGELREQLDRFYELWTLKESYIKCCGMGLSMPLHSFSMKVSKDGQIKVETENQTIQLLCQRLEVPFGYKGAVISQGDDYIEEVTWLELREVILGIDII